MDNSSITRETVRMWLGNHNTRMATLQQTSLARLQDLDRALESGDQKRVDELQTTMTVLAIQKEDCDDAIRACQAILRWTPDDWTRLRNQEKQVIEQADELFSRAMPRSE